MKIGIIGAMDSETTLIKENLKNKKEEKIKGFIYTTGTHGNKEIVLVTSSIGKVNSTISAQIMIDNFKVELIINTGIAGGLSSELKPMSMVIGEKLTFHDFDHEILKNYFPYQEYFYPDPKFVEKAEKIAKINGIHAIKGTIVTGDQFIESSEKKKELKEKYDAKACEMEGCAIANTAFINDLPFLVIRTISDLADDGGMSTYEEFKEESSKQSAKLVMQLVEEI